MSESSGFVDKIVSLFRSSPNSKEPNSKVDKSPPYPVPYVAEVPNPVDDPVGFNRTMILHDEQTGYGERSMLSEGDLDPLVMAFVTSKFPESYGDAATYLHNLKSQWFHDHRRQPGFNPDGWKATLPRPEEE